MKAIKTAHLGGLFHGLAIVVCAASVGCVGRIGDSSEDPGAVTGGAGAPNPPGSIRDIPLPRLSHDEYIRTIADLTQQVLPSDAKQIMDAIAPLTADLPADALVTIGTEKHGGFARGDQSEQQQYSDTPITVGVALGQAMTRTPSRVATLLAACAPGSTASDPPCLEAFIKSFGSIALRHPLSDEDVSFYAATASQPPAPTDLANIIAVMLASPRFLYRVESGAQLVEGNTFQLDAWELAARLSYHFWGSMPDAILRDAAQTGKLLTDDGYASEVKRMMADPRTSATMRDFFQQWFWPLIELPPLDSRASDPAFRAFAGANLPGPMLGAHMIDDVLDAASFVVGQGGSWKDLLTNRLSFARDPDLAAIYGVPPWNGQDDPPMLPSARAGLLTRAAFLATGTINTRPIMKGVFIRSTLLCDALPPPPANAANTPVVLSNNQTTRDVLEAITEQDGSVCAACHKTLINPLGFASENFDGLGRERSEQSFFDGAGNKVGSKVVDTSSVPSVTPDDLSPSSGIQEVTDRIAQSGRVEPCLATRFFRFAFRHLEDDSEKDTVDALAKLASTGSLADLFKGVALLPSFRQRVIDP